MVLNDALTVIQVLLVDINTGDVETFAFDQVMKFSIMTPLPMPTSRMEVFSDT